MSLRISLLVLSLVALAACAPRQQVVDNVFISASKPKVTIEPAENLAYLGKTDKFGDLVLGSHGGAKETIHVFAEIDAEGWVKKILTIESYSLPPTVAWVVTPLSIDDGYILVGERELHGRNYFTGTSVRSISDWALSTGLFEDKKFFTYYLYNYLESYISDTHIFIMETYKPLPAMSGWSLDYNELPSANRKAVDEFFAAGLEGFATVR